MEPCKGEEGQSCNKNNNCTYPDCKIEEIRMKAEEQIEELLEEHLKDCVVTYPVFGHPSIRKLKKDLESLFLQQREEAERQAFEAARETEEESTGDSMVGVGWVDDVLKYEDYEDYKSKKG